ncbi:hypothetical protein [Natrinema saccharevitans]|nr:hypothetical protein [Natrinema saccharevitans]
MVHLRFLERVGAVTNFDEVAPADIREELRALTLAGYTGVSSEVVDGLE